MLFLQDQIQNNLYNHQEVDADFLAMLDEVQELLGNAYQHAGEKFNDSCEDKETNI